MSGAALALEESVLLGYALVLRLASDLGVRALAIKGPVVELQGLQDPKTSVDVDVLVDPGALPVLRAGLERIGWSNYGLYDAPSIIPMHSVNHRHELWPCEIDLHHWFPGFLADPTDVFEALWARRTTVTMAHTPVVTCDPVGTAAIAALNHLRAPHEAPAVRKLADVVRRTWTAEQVADVATLAAASGAASTLRPWLDLIDAPVVSDRRDLVVPLSDWEMLTRADVRSVLPWIVGAERTTWWRRPIYLWRAIWLDDEYFTLWSGRSELTRREVVRARLRRLRRAFRTLPHAWREYRRLRR